MATLVTIKAPKPWERQNGEDTRFYDWFVDFAASDGVVAAWTRERAEFYGVPAATLVYRAAVNNWKERRALFLEAQFLDKDSATEVESLRTVTRRRIRYHAALSQKFLAKAELLVDSYMEKDLFDEEGNLLGTQLVRGVLREASEALAKGIEMERLSYGLPGTITRVEADLRTQVEVALNIQNRVLAIVGAHICEGCQQSVAEELASIQAELDGAQREILALGGGD